MPAYSHDHSTTVSVYAPAGALFEFLDDHTRLAAHMSKPSMAMGGGSMALDFDAAMGKAVGSRLRLAGSAFGIPLGAEEVVTEREPSRRKVWETTGEPRLLVIGAYRMGFTIEDEGRLSRLTVFIQYEWPRRAPWRWLGRLFARAYARWCTERMAGDAAQQFA